MFDPGSPLALSWQDLPEKVKEVVCFLSWEVDGREAAQGSDGQTFTRTRRIHLSWSNDYLKDSYLLFVAPEKFARPNSDAQYLWKDDALFLGRDIPSDGSKRALIKSWMDLCYSTHKGPCAHVTDNREEFEDMVGHYFAKFLALLGGAIESWGFSTNCLLQYLLKTLPE